MKHLFAVWIVSQTTLALAAEYNQVDLSHSTIGFEIKAMGATVAGSFRRFDAFISLDPQKPQAAKGWLEIDLTSAETDAGEANEELQKPLWFNAKDFPAAQFSLTALQPLSSGRYLAQGILTIKGRTRRVFAPLNVREKDGSLLLAGRLVIQRLDYAVGERHWADVSVVADEVAVSFAFPVRKGK